MAEGKTNIKIIILGAGVTGLSAGVRFLENGCDVCLLTTFMSSSFLFPLPIADNSHRMILFLTGI